MGIEVVQGSPQTIWCPMSDAVTLYVGGMVMHDSSGPLRGVEPLDIASGVMNDTNKDVPFGVVIGTNRKTPLYDTTYNCEYITSPAADDAHDGASIDYVGVEGPWAKGDPVAMVKVALITPCTVLRAPLYATAYGTAPALLTATNTSSDGLGITTNAADFTGIAQNLQTIYCRKGGNAGSYRTTYDVSSTVHTWAIAMRNDIAIGDTFVMAPVRFQGMSTVQFDGAATYIECDNAPVLDGTARWGINVIRLDLSEAGKEYCEFMFCSDHFSYYTDVD